MTTLAGAIATVRRTQPMLVIGQVVSIRGMTVLVEDLPLPVGSLVSIRSRAGVEHAVTFGEVVGFTREHAVVMLLGQTGGIRAGDRVFGEQSSPTVGVSRQMLGRVLDGLARPIDNAGPILDTHPVPLSPDPVSAMKRRRISQPLATGIRAMDTMTTLGRGQRLGIFAGPGVGKSTLLGTIARRTAADVNVIALIGERGREVKDFIDHALGPEGLARSVVIVATGDESPLLRLRAAKLACSCAEFFRDLGRDVLLMMDSITRFAHAQRQIGLSVGEPPATKGYTPSVFSTLAALLERAGTLESGGSITGLYTILVEGDDMTEPISDAARGILDGHVILSRKLAQKAHFPAIDVLDSVSRVADDVTDGQQQAARRHILRLMAVYREVEDLVQIGAYAKGTNPEADVAIELMPQINEHLRQAKGQTPSFEESRANLVRLAELAQSIMARNAKSRPRAA
ncbi:MAG: FliI/YscN family ATPase [Phycisphaerales bacterium]|nr:FliI/YscN family ATPase [Phycisphaerales bacterium]